MTVMAVIMITMVQMTMIMMTDKDAYGMAMVTMMKASTMVMTVTMSMR